MAQLLNPFSKIRLRNFLLWVVVSMPILMFILFFNGNDDTVTSAISFLWLYGMIILWARFTFKKYGVKLAYLFGKIPTIKTLAKLLGIVVALVLFSFGIVLVMAYLFSFIGSNFDQKYWEAYGITNNPSTKTPELYFLIDTISAVIFAPIIEEFFFRGILFERFATKWGIKRGIIFSSLCFGILHGDLIGAFIFGCVMCLIYIKTRSLFATIFCHFTANLIPTLLGFVAFSSSNSSTTSTPQDYQIIGITGAVFIIVAVPVLISAIKRMRSANNIAVLPYVVNRKMGNE